MIPDQTVVADAVSMSFGDTRALDKCSFSAEAGEIHAIVGENGSGKSTLAKIISGVLQPDHGTVSVNRREPTSPRTAQRAGLATVFQEVLLAENASVADNVFIGFDGYLRKAYSYRQKREKAEALLHRLTGQPISADRIVAELPLALKQWVVISRALIRNPSVLVLDESTAALDLAGARRLYRLAGELRDQGKTILVVTHRIGELTSFADRATVLRDGKDIGILSGADINERSLLELMSGSARARTAINRTPRSAPEEGTQPVVSVRDAQLAEGSRPFSFDVFAGQIVGLAGLEGQGQSAFAKVLVGFETLRSGTITGHGHEASRVIDGPDAAAAAGIAYVSGDRAGEGIFPNMSILENFGIGVYNRHSTLSWINFGSVGRTFNKYVDRLSIKAPNANKRIGSLSGGHQQKVLIARALASSPGTMVFNDPARGVDARTKTELQEYLLQLADDGRTVIYVSSELEEFPNFCDRVAVFRDGTVSEWVEREEVSTDNLLRAMFGYHDALSAAELLEMES